MGYYYEQAKQEKIFLAAEHLPAATEILRPHAQGGTYWDGKEYCPLTSKTPWEKVWEAAGITPAFDKGGNVVGVDLGDEVKDRGQYDHFLEIAHLFAPGGYVEVYGENRDDMFRLRTGVKCGKRVYATIVWSE